MFGETMMFRNIISLDKACGSTKKFVENTKIPTNMAILNSNDSIEGFDIECSENNCKFHSDC